MERTRLTSRYRLPTTLVMSGPYARAPRPSNGGRQFQYQRQPPPAAPTQGSLIAAQNTYNRITPGVLGASMGGQGKTPQTQWDAMFPNGQPSPEPDVNSAVIQHALNAANGSGVVTPNTSAVPVATTVGPGTVQRANGTGNTLTSTYGGGSSHPGAPVDLQGPTLSGAPLGSAPAVTSSTGVQRVPDWQQQVTAAHPEIGVAGSEGNKAYVAAYSKAQTDKGVGKFDPVQLAHDTMSPIYAQRVQSAVGKSAEGIGDEETAMAGTQQAKANAAADTANAAKPQSTFTEGSPLDYAEKGVNAIKNAPTTLPAAVAAAEDGVRRWAGVRDPNMTPGAEGMTSPAMGSTSDVQSGKAIAKELSPTGYDSPTALNTAVQGALTRNAGVGKEGQDLLDAYASYPSTPPPTSPSSYASYPNYGAFGAGNGTSSMPDAAPSVGGGAGQNPNQFAPGNPPVNPGSFDFQATAPGGTATTTPPVAPAAQNTPAPPPRSDEED